MVIILTSKCICKFLQCQAKKEEAEQPVAATSSAEDATEGKSLPKPKSKSGSPKSGKSAAEEQQAPESDLGEKPEKKKSKKTVGK